MPLPSRTDRPRSDRPRTDWPALWPCGGKGLSRALGLGAAILALAACVPAGPTPRSAPVLGGAVDLGLPPGYCIDRSATRESVDSAVVLMGRCSSASAPDPAIVTVSVGTAGSASVLAGGGRELAAFFTSDAGRAMLSRSGRARDLNVIQASEQDGVFLLHLGDRMLGDSWRAVTGVKGRLVAISARAAPGQRLETDKGRELVAVTAAAIRRAGKTGS